MQNVTTSVEKYFTIVPTEEQVQAFKHFEDFISESNTQDFLIVQGSAGTGKTTIVKAFVNFLSNINTGYYLAAPTGRAAKILSAKTGENASTLHHLIYKVEDIKDSAGQVARVKFIRRNNLAEQRHVYIIDEASMVSDTLDKEGFFLAQASALEDFIRFVKSGNANNKIVFIGDSFQLPPVKSTFSPALDAPYLKKKFNLAGKVVELTQVKRQDRNSALYLLASRLRLAIEQKTVSPTLNLPGITNEAVSISNYIKLFDFNKLDKVVFLVWRNEVADRINHAIRKKLHHNLNRLNQNDVIVVNKTGLFNGHLVVNGEIGVIKQLFWHTLEKHCNLDFIEVEIAFANGIDTLCIKTKLLLDSLEVPGGWIPKEKSSELYADRMRHNRIFRESKNINDDPYLSALQLRFGYALTCHKAQGGEWENVFLYHELPYGSERLQWLYTAITRSSTNLFTVK